MSGNEDVINMLRAETEANRAKWQARAPEVRAAARDARMAKDTWRQMSGLKLVFHEMASPGLRPFATGFGVCLLGAVAMQCSFSNEMKEKSLYWSTFHAKKH
mmetsp:Transcript_34933/g.53570  ORF Transcript_34933/g.53570 Transcript_34933/m.53570 type:complete len:102 (-) Transcript_34933:169-474(-)